MTYEEAKNICPSFARYQFQPHGEFAVGDRVSFMQHKLRDEGYIEERMEGIIQWFFNPGQNFDWTTVKIQSDDGDEPWMNIWKISKVKQEVPETAETPAENQPIRQLTLF